eukprot:687870-Lingulodinium_polyedra.AAC.1
MAGRVLQQGASATGVHDPDPELCDQFAATADEGLQGRPDLMEHHRDVGMLQHGHKGHSPRR